MEYEENVIFVYDMNLIYNLAVESLLQEVQLDLELVAIHEEDTRFSPSE